MSKEVCVLTDFLLSIADNLNFTLRRWNSSILDICWGGFPLCTWLCSDTIQYKRFQCSFLYHLSSPMCQMFSNMCVCIGLVEVLSKVKVFTRNSTKTEKSRNGRKDLSTFSVSQCSHFFCQWTSLRELHVIWLIVL